MIGMSIRCSFPLGDSRCTQERHFPRLRLRLRLRLFGLLRTLLLLLLLEFLQHLQLAGRHQGRDLLGQVLADALEVGQLAAGICDDFRRRLGQVADRAGRVAIGADAERIRPLEFEDVGDGIEGVGNFGISHDRAEVLMG